MKSQKEQVEDLLRKFWRCIKESRPEPSVVAEAASWLLAETLAYVREDSRRVAAEGLTEMLMAQAAYHAEQIEQQGGFVADDNTSH
jgi:hypothetical protein